MEFIFTLLAGIAFPAPPTLAGWLIWCMLLGALVYALHKGRDDQTRWKGREWGLFIAFIILIPLTSLFIGIRISPASTRPLPGLPADTPGSALMLFSAIPWMLGSLLLGPMGAAVLGGLAGLLRGAWDTYSLFTILEFAALAAWFSVNSRQRFRTPIYAFLRQPLSGALILIPLHVLFYMMGVLFTQWGMDTPAAARLDFALSNTPLVSMTFGGEVLIAGIVLQVLAVAFPAWWGGAQPLQPSPGERSMESRFLFGAGAFIMLLLLTLLVGDWVVAGRAARDMLQKRMSSAGEAAARSVPFFLESGQSLAGQMANDPRFLNASDAELNTAIAEQIRAVPYFEQIYVVDALNGEWLGGYPASSAADFAPTLDEQNGVALAFSGVLNQMYSIPPSVQDEPARVSFLAAVLGEAGQVRRVIIARASLQTNPLALPLLEGLGSLSDLEGSGLLLDENSRVVYSSGGNQPEAAYTSERRAEPFFYENTAPDGTRQIVYYAPVEGMPWSVVFTIPARQVQQFALNIAMPLSVMIIILALAAILSLRLTLRVVTGSLQSLAIEANRIAEGKLDRPLQAEGVDEVGQLRRAFEQMRVSLQLRLEEINRLLKVSQGVASSLEMQDAVRPVLEAIESMGANSVRVALDPSALSEAFVDKPSRFALGSAQDDYAHLDKQILALAKQQEQVVIPNLSRSREIDLDPSKPRPLALLAVALRHENRFYGVVWAGFEQPRKFTDADVRFMTTLAGQAALAVSNAYLYLSVEASRRQLESVLNSTPDLVLVTDYRDRLLLANRSAQQALGIGSKDSGAETQKVLKQKPLIALLQGTTRENQSAEVVLSDNRTYLATASTVIFEGRPIGRVCIMRDVTHFKELDTMKSEFVATVSHDLRSPLTLMRGYATMLDMVGELNEQQHGYVKKMISGVENMSQLVNNLLDLGRIEIGVGLQVENVSIIDIIERITSSLQLHASQKNIDLSVELARDMPNTVEADPSLLYQGVYNLVENAIKYTPENGSVKVAVSAKPGFVLFEVADSGIGIPQEDLPHLFEKFYRTKQRETRAQSGSGLGLAIVQSIAQSHGGRVWVESVLGKGSIFHLQIPLAQPKPARPS